MRFRLHEGALLPYIAMHSTCKSQHPKYAHIILIQYAHAFAKAYEPVLKQNKNAATFLTERFFGCGFRVSLFPQPKSFGCGNNQFARIRAY